MKAFSLFLSLSLFSFSAAAGGGVDAVIDNYHRLVGWDYQSVDRTVSLGTSGKIARVEEYLTHPEMGDWTGIASLTLRDKEWQLSSYQLVPLGGGVDIQQVSIPVTSSSASVSTTSKSVSSSASAQSEAEEEGGSKLFGLEINPYETGCTKPRHKTNRKASC